MTADYAFIISIKMNSILPVIGVRNVPDHGTDLESDKKSENVKPPVTFEEFLAINDLVRTEGSILAIDLDLY